MKNIRNMIIIVTILLVWILLAVLNIEHPEIEIPMSCESKGETLESFTYNEKKKQIIIQCVR